MAARFCARLAIAFCLVMFGFGGAIERGLSSHVGLDSALTLVVSGDVAADHHDSVGNGGGVEVVDHGCHGCAAAPQTGPHGAPTPVAFSERIAWASVPSASSREPLIELRPPRA